VLQSLAVFMKARPVAEWPGIHVAKSFYWQYEAQTQYGCVKASHLFLFTIGCGEKLNVVIPVPLRQAKIRPKLS
jgi:hypothetical protein